MSNLSNINPARLLSTIIMKDNQQGRNTEENNPCFKEQELTFKCFNKYNYDKEKCFFHIENYKACKKFWGEVRSYRYRQGQYPLLPPLEERERIRQEYKSSKH